MASLDHPNIVRYLGAQVMSGGWELVIFQESATLARAHICMYLTWRHLSVFGRRECAGE
jgi:hypothetical protein